MKNHKDEIIATRKKGFGSSDAKMIAKIGRLESVSESDNRRIAEMLGLTERLQFSTKSTELGNEIENHVFELIKNKFPNTVSNLFYQSEELTNKYGFGVFNHIDYECETKSFLVWIENKATKKDINQTIDEYATQLAWHSELLKEKAKKLGKFPKLFVSHYQTEVTECFSAENFNILEIDINGFEIETENIHKGLSHISELLKSDFEYKPSDELYANNLPVSVQEKIKTIHNAFNQINEANKLIEDFKETMLDLMVKNNVKSIKNDFFSITLIKKTVGSSFDRKTFEKEHPELAKKYEKKTNRKSYVIIKTK